MTDRPTILATAPLDATLKAAHCLRVPGLLVQLALLSYRYLFVLAEELGRLRVALPVAGYAGRVGGRVLVLIRRALTVARIGRDRPRQAGHRDCRGADQHSKCAVTEQCGIAGDHPSAAGWRKCAGACGDGTGSCSGSAKQSLPAIRQL